MIDARAGLAAEESGRIPDIKELPPSVRETLPDIKISGHVYFETPEDRLVIINGRSAREGETVVSGLHVEEITSSGVIFNFEDRRFSMPGY
jgi:general secretion pathway protein B